MSETARRPRPCPKCGHANGWKNFKCKNPACGTALRETLAERMKHATHVASCRGCGEALADHPIQSLSPAQLTAALDGAPSLVRDFVAAAKDRMIVNICECGVSFVPLDGDKHRPIYGRSLGRWGVSHLCRCHASRPFDA